MPCSGLCNLLTSTISHSFLAQVWIGYPSGCLTSFTKPAAKSLDNSLPMARRFSQLKHRMPCLIIFELGLMLRICSVTSRETASISVGLHANMSLLHWRKSMSLFSYLGSKLVPICMVLAGFSALICMTLVSSSTLKMLDVGGILG
jgi:hypothetical protein